MGCATTRLDAVLLATPPESPEITEIGTFRRTPACSTASQSPHGRFKKVTEKALARELLVLADGHCRSQPGHGRMRRQARTTANRATRVNAGFDTRNARELCRCGLRSHSAASAGRRIRSGTAEIVMLPLAGKSTRTIRLASRPGFPRPQALRALGGGGGDTAGCECRSAKNWPGSLSRSAL